MARHVLAPFIQSSCVFTFPQRNIFRVKKRPANDPQHVFLFQTEQFRLAAHPFSFPKLLLPKVPSESLAFLFSWIPPPPPQSILDPQIGYVYSGFSYFSLISPVNVGTTTSLHILLNHHTQSFYRMTILLFAVEKRR
jgi:hypothetical protein